ncbi:hypothetical protein [Staphylothermus hellenicus]|uniref:ABC transporter domain-containing protein n=1 Tax=Staphylothermus hellenicus (strain DSM 12710 / JCM 10830 / BK20S6-10-b1 / P8) TaxID=591019 RepID=D7D9B1_STAHD|nr:hypothetical protein [Staphylothermus hellenicus]ADI32357.1 hypothetical protein Shell_1259 [Staphylothermus hellenicus DSM 12710]
MIIFDNVLIQDLLGKSYKLFFHIPTPSITLIITPALFNKTLLANYILGNKKPSSGNIVSRIKIQGVKGLFIPELAQGKSLVLDEILTIDEKDYTLYSEILNLLRQYGYKIDNYPLIIKNIPKPLLYLISSIYVLRKSGNLAVLIEPYKELDDILWSRLSMEIYEKRSKGKTIVIISSNKNLIDYINYEHLVIIRRNNKIFETSTRPVTFKDFLKETTPIEIIVERDSLSKLLSLKCLKGIIILNEKMFYVFIEKSLYRTCLSHLVDLQRKRIIRRMRIVKQSLVEE